MASQKAIAAEAEKLRRRNELILAAAGEGIFGLDAEGRTTFANPSAQEITGWTEDEMIGFVQHDRLHHSRADGSPYTVGDCPILKTLRDGKPRRVADEVFWRKDGTSFPVEYVSTPIIESGAVVGAVISFRNISKRREAEALVRESEARYRTIFNSSYDAIFVVDMEGGEKILDANDEACRMLGYSRAELTGLGVADIHPREMPRMRAFWNDVAKHGKWQTNELTCLAKAGDRIPAELSATTIGFKGRTCMLVLAHDMRRRLQSEARGRELQADLHHVSRLSAMGEMASGLAHELNQPLTAIMNYVQASRRILRAAGGGEKVLSYMDKAVDQAARAGQIIHNMREVVAKGETARAAEDINGVVEEAANLGLVGGTRKTVGVRFELAPGLPSVMIDRIQIQQVVVNLVRNALDALADAAKREIVIRTAPGEDGGVDVALSDTGPGISPDVEKRLFRSFVTTKPDGMGLGLSISRSIIDGHGGRLWAAANEGGGTTFHFTLPPGPAEDRPDER